MADAPARTVAEMPIIDVDSHVTEPADLWTSRLARRWHDDAPRVVWDESGREHRWRVGRTTLQSVGAFSMGGWREPYPFVPSSFDDIDPAAYDARARLARLDEYGVHAQVLYPNLLGFDTQVFTQLDGELALECVRAYNDFLVDWASADPDRLIPIMCLPFWDIEASVAELERSHDRGHRGLVLAAHYEKVGYPNIAEPVWEPLLAAAQERGLSVNFHIGFSQLTNADIEQMWGTRTRAAMEATPPDVLASVRAQTVGFLSNAQAIVDIIVNGVCHRFPRLRFVSVESGFGYVPFVLQALDWQWSNDGGHRVHPDWERPSDYFRRQISTTFWYERPAVEHLVEFQDNVMFETDFPHPTSLTPGPWSAARNARETVAGSLGHIDPVVARKVLHDNAARIYGVAASSEV